jgi:beta-lactamase superfamily II metal-dependent hydrolase
MTFQHTVRVAFLDVGQGDSIVVTVPATQEAVIIDCPEADTVFEYLKSEQLRYIRALIITHLHLDHYRDAVSFLENCATQLGIECERVVFNWPSNRQPSLPDADGHSEIYNNPTQNKRQRITAYQELKAWADQPSNDDKFIGLLRPRRGEFIDMDGVIAQAIKVLQPSHAQFGKLYDLGLNNTSAIIRVEGPGASALLTADIEPVGWAALQHRCSVPQSDVLKFPHHGAWKAANPDELLNAVQPSVVVISVGTDGIKYNHPNPHVFEAIRRRPGVRLLCTQVTRRCEMDVSLHSAAVDAKLEANARSRAVYHVRTSRGCPCAGTIVVELGEQARVIQPAEALHRDLIIKEHFRTHQCSV